MDLLNVLYIRELHTVGMKTFVTVYIMAYTAYTAQHRP